MLRRGQKIYAPGSISGFMWGLLGMLCAVYPLIAIYFGVMVLFNFNFLVPTIGVIFGIAAIVGFIRAKKYSKRQSLASGKGFAWAGLIFGIIGVLTGSTFSISYVMIANEKKGPPNHPVGDAKVFFYGDENHRETATGTILLPDETILTTGSRSTSRDQSGNRIWDTILLKTDLEGKQIWLKILEDRYSGRAVINSDDDILLSVRSKRFSNRADKYPSLGIIKLNLEGDSLDGRIYDFGDTIKAPRIVSLADKKSLIYAIIDSNLLMMKVDKNGDSLWSKTYPIEKQSMERFFLQTNDGGFVLAGCDPIQEHTRELFRIMKTDSLGNLIWENPAGDSIDFSPLQINEMADESLLIAGNRQARDLSVEGRILKLDREGRLIWDKPIGYGSYTFTTGMIPWTEGNYLIVGWAPISNMYKLLNFGRVKSWDTYSLAIVSPEVELIHSFHGAHDVFAPWGITPVDVGYCVITGFGGRWKEDDKTEISNQDIGLLHYRAN